MSIPFSSSVSPRRTLCGRPRARTAITSAAPRSMPGTSRSGVRQPRGPTTSGAMVGSPRRGHARVGAEGHPPHDVGHGERAPRRAATHHPARAEPRERVGRRRVRARAARATPSTSRSATRRRARAPGRRARAPGPPACPARRAPRGRCALASRRARLLRGSGAGGAASGIVARTTRSACVERALALVERRRHVRELHEVALLEERRHLGQRQPEVGRAPQRRAASRRSSTRARRSRSARRGTGARRRSRGRRTRRSAASRAARRGATSSSRSKRDLPRRARRRRRRDGPRALAPAVRRATRAARRRATPTAPHDSARSSATHSSRCARGGGFGFGCASGVEAVGSSTRMVCGFVQSVTTSLFARAIDTGSGGQDQRVPSRLARQRDERQVERRLPPPGLRVDVDARQARRRAAVLIGEREPRRLERPRRVAVALQLEPARQHRLALAVRDDDVERRRVAAQPALGERVDHLRPLGAPRRRLDALGPREARGDEQSENAGQSRRARPRVIAGSSWRAARTGRAAGARTIRRSRSPRRRAPACGRRARRASAICFIAVAYQARTRGSPVSTTTLSPLSRSSKRREAHVGQLGVARVDAARPARRRAWPTASASARS